MTDTLPPDAPPRPSQTLGEIGLTHFAPYLMNRIMGRYNGDLQAELKRHGLTTMKMRTLAVLAVVPGLTINELSVYAVSEQSTMSRTLEALEAAGLVRREERQSDGRVREIYLTEAGRSHFDLIWPLLYDGYRKLFEGIDREERQAFVQTLQKMLRNVRRNDF